MRIITVYYVSIAYGIIILLHVTYAIAILHIIDINKFICDMLCIYCTICLVKLQSLIYCMICLY